VEAREVEAEYAVQHQQQQAVVVVDHPLSVQSFSLHGPFLISYTFR
jgi:D-hexose-6-phosphate mutarotase